MAAVVQLALVVGPNAVVRAEVDATQAQAPVPRVEWRPEWPRFRPWEYAASAAMGATSWYVRNYRLAPQEPRWQGPNWFDDTLRGWLRADTPDGRHLSQYASDRLTELGYMLPFAVDVPAALLVHHQPGVAWQLLMMNLEAFAVAGLLNNILFYEVGRARPSAQDCAADPSYDVLCGIGNNASLPSGHTLTVATGAGLTCVHHRYLPLYGGAAVDAGACAAMVVATLATATTRIMADRHYATDDLVGIAIGFGSGYGLPWLLHYRQGNPNGHTEATGPSAVTVAPFHAKGTLGLSLVGFL